MFRRTVKKPQARIVKAFCMTVTTRRLICRSEQPFAVPDEGLAVVVESECAAALRRWLENQRGQGRLVKGTSNEASLKPTATSAKPFSTPGKPVSSQGIAR